MAYEHPPDDEELFFFSREREERVVYAVGCLCPYYVGGGEDVVEVWAINILNALTMASGQPWTAFDYDPKDTSTCWTATHREHGYVLKVRKKFGYQLPKL